MFASQNIRIVKAVSLGLVVAIAVTVFAPAEALAKKRSSGGRSYGSSGGSSSTVKTPFGRVPRYRPSLIITKQG